MCGENKGLGIIFHSGSYDRVYHGFSLALTTLALGRETVLFFGYWAMEYLKEDAQDKVELDGEAEKYRKILKKNIERGDMQKISELIKQVKAMGARIYACTSSMGLLNITRDELVKEVDKSAGLTTFLAETSDYQVIFI